MYPPGISCPLKCTPRGTPRVRGRATPQFFAPSGFRLLMHTEKRYHQYFRKICTLPQLAELGIRTRYQWKSYCKIRKNTNIGFPCNLAGFRYFLWSISIRKKFIRSHEPVLFVGLPPTPQKPGWKSKFRVIFAKFELPARFLRGRGQTNKKCRFVVAYEIFSDGYTP